MHNLDPSLLGECGNDYVYIFPGVGMIYQPLACISNCVQPHIPRSTYNHTTPINILIDAENIPISKFTARTSVILV